LRKRELTESKYIGGFKGEWNKAPSGVNCEIKLQLLKDEGVIFDRNGVIVDKTRLWNEFDVKDE
jgi:methylated-DNA-[protein]-cysteine S-methyltransferase